MERIDINPSKYVVLDVETNGLRSKTDDMLSLSIYKPDDGKLYDRFLPLELARKVKTTRYNGIKTEDLIGKTPLTQEEFDQIVEDFDLKNRTILFYAGRKFDELFFRNYLKRHFISGAEELQFYNYKRQIFSSSFSGGNVTKDNLCRMFHIDHVHEVHSGKNDCVLEWELFQKLDGYYYFITTGESFDSVFRLNQDYIVPVSFLSTHRGLREWAGNIPVVDFSAKIKKVFTVDGSGLSKFGTNFNGMIVEHIINSMLHVQKENNTPFLYANKCKLSYIGKIPSSFESVPMDFNEDGTVTAANRKDQELEVKLNNAVGILRERLDPLIKYIRDDIFGGKTIKSQELVVDRDYNVLALCDLSSDDTVLEIKSNPIKPEYYKDQLFFESRGRKSYHMNMLWSVNNNTGDVRKIEFSIYEVHTKINREV